MILRRIGNKAKLKDKIIPYFPAHKVYYELFFGTGSIYFSKPKSEYSILNDLDNDVYNLFMVVKDNAEALEQLLSITPISEDLFYYWKKNKETTPINKALRFLYLSSFSYLGKSDTFILLHSNSTHKDKLQKLIKVCASQFEFAMLRNKDFRLFFDGISVTDKHIGKENRFIYADPPYLNTTNNYNTPKWTEKDSIDLFNTLENTGIKYAMSEFDNEFIITQAKNRNLNIIEIGERRSLQSTKKEILITNYNVVNPPDLFNQF